jgi:hypothetical protein
MKKWVLLSAAIVALIAGAAFFGGYQVGARPAASGSQAYTIRARDWVTCHTLRRPPHTRSGMGTS